MTRRMLSQVRVCLLLLVFLALVPALGLALYTAAEQRRLAAANARETALRLVRFVSSGHEQLIAGAYQLLIGLAHVPDVRRGDPEACSTLMATLLHRYPYYANLGAIQSDGQLFCSALPFVGPVMAADRLFFRRTLETRDFAIGEYQIGRVTGKATLNVGYPILDEIGTVHAVVFAALDLAWLQRLVASAQVPEGASLLIVDQVGTIVAPAPEPETLVGQAIPEASLIHTIITGHGEGTAEATGADGLPRLYAFTPLRGASGDGDVYVSLGIPTVMAFAEVHRILVHHLIGLGLVTLLTLAATRAVGHRYILRQVYALVHATRRLTAGELSARTGIPPGPGELTQLASAFDEMAQARQQTQEALVQQVQALTQANTDLRRSNQELDDFAYIASHDLKEPLRGLHNYATFLLEDYGDVLDDPGRAKLETLTRLTQRMEALINALLYYSRVGRVDLAVADTDLNKVVAAVVDSLAISLQEVGVEVRLRTPLPTMRCDAARVGEIFHNLITNAMKYNDTPEKWIDIGCLDGQAPQEDGTRQDRLTLQPHGARVFYLRDNGIGIAEKHRDAIFRIFKRLHARDKYGGGTGAGLTIVKKIVERHGGRIWVESTPGHGTTVYWTLEANDDQPTSAHSAGRRQS